MSIDALKARLPEAFRDARLNLSALASEEILAEPTKWGLLFACAIATRNAEVRDAFAAEAAARLPEEVQQAARAAATVMAMNNVYYRAVHLASNKEYAKMPARLRMNVIANPGAPKLDFELWCLAASAINGCGACIDSHEKVLRDGGVLADQIHAALRYAAIVQSTAVALEAAATAPASAA
jgi:alkyl hydroperoxide reductase subunit D